MLATSPLSLSYSFAEDSVKSEQKISKSTNKEQNFGAIITGKIVDKKPQVKRVTLLEDLSKGNMRINSVEGVLSWAYINQKSYQSGIIIYDGNAVKTDQKLGEIQIKMIHADAVTINLNLIDKTNNPHSFLHRIMEDNDLIYRIIFSGKMIEAGSETFAIIFSNYGLKNPEIIHYIPSIQI